MTLDDLFEAAVVAQLYQPGPSVISRGTTVGEALARMRESAESVLQIVDDGDKLVGVFTEVDYVRRILHEGVDTSRPIDEVMTSELKTVRRDTPASTAFELMSRGNFRHLPVIDREGRPIGLLAVRHLIQYLAERYPAEILAMAPNVHQVVEADGG